MYCTECGTHDEDCKCSTNENWVEGVDCDNCGCPCAESELDRCGFCQDCQDAFQEEYGDDWESHTSIFSLVYEIYSKLK